MASVEDLSALTAAKHLADLLADIAGAAARSVILHGSLAAGGFRPGRSDIDVLAVIDGGLADAQVEALTRVVRRANVGTAAGVDLHVVTPEAVGVPARAVPVELYIGRHDVSAVGFEVERRVTADPDLLADLSMARTDGRALKGAPPREVIAPVPVDWVVDRGRHWLTTWRSLADDAENAAFMVLTACRIWRFAVENVHCSKAQAAEWAIGRDPSLTVVRQVVQQDERGPASRVAEQGMVDLLDTVLYETARAR
ncbi:aminoglycoside adenylyltransferase domain-containing protein [Micromonospora sp. NPDC001898]|uniref:aminoglycoside adenylyltransferase domain-containing protein n=1 Tax=Micromonospora sp. NPDC001898 TaxID=3364221 RepID=UPI00367EFE81